MEGALGEGSWIANYAAFQSPTLAHRNCNHAEYDNEWDLSDNLDIEDQTDVPWLERKSLSLCSALVIVISVLRHIDWARTAYAVDTPT